MIFFKVDMIITFSTIFVYIIFLKNVNLCCRGRPPADGKSQIILLLPQVAMLFRDIFVNTILNILPKGLESSRNVF